MSATLLSGGSKATALHDRTTGGGGAASSPPPGTFQSSAMDQVEEIITGALEAAERVLGIRWKNDQHEARRHKPFDEREFAIHVLSAHIGTRTSLVAANEDVERWTIENIRRSHGRNAQGEPNPKKPCKRGPTCTICRAADELLAA